MTTADGAGPTLAERIAARGRDALVERLRKAYTDAAAAHADIVQLDDVRIEALVQAAADRADGLQWRRALANVASEELGVSLAEALTLPAVAQAQEIVGAPSYEASLAELVARPVPPAVTAPLTSVPAAAAPAPEHEAAAGEPESTAEAEPAAAEAEPDDELAVATPETVTDDEPAAATPEPVVEEQPVREPRQPEMVIDEPELHGATGELDVVEADDAIFGLMPPPEPVEDEDELYDPVPVEIEDEPPPLLEQVPYEPELEYDALEVPSSPEDPEAEPIASEFAGEPTQAHSILDDAPQFTGPLAENGAAAGAGSTEEEVDGQAPEAEAYGEGYGGEHTVYPPPEDRELQVTAHHLGGVANLPSGRNGLELRLSEHGLDILQPSGDIIGRLHWEEIDEIEVSAARGRLRRQARTQSRILVRTKHGDASFEIPGIASDELEARVEPLVSRYRVSS